MSALCCILRSIFIGEFYSHTFIVKSLHNNKISPVPSKKPLAILDYYSFSTTGIKLKQNCAFILRASLHNISQQTCAWFYFVLLSFIVLSPFFKRLYVSHLPMLSSLVLLTGEMIRMPQCKLEQLERFEAPAASGLPILLIHIGSQVQRRQSQIHKFKEFAKISNFETNFTSDTPSEVAW